MTYAEQIRAHLRLAILQSIESVPGYGVHEYLLLERVRALGLGTSADALRTEFNWLAEQGLLEIEPLEAGSVARITARGADAARGLAIVPGITRPRP
jgi:DNA-binding GntR family transcriptional regulator